MLSDVIPLLIAVLTIVATGAVVFYGIVREPERFFKLERLAYCYPLGLTVLSLSLFVASWAGMRFQPVAVVLMVAVAAIIVRRVRGQAMSDYWLRKDVLGLTGAPLSEFEWVLVLIPVACLATRAVACPLVPLNDWDSFGVWGFKGKILFYGPLKYAGEYWHKGEYRFMNQPYPILVPVMYAWVCSVLGRWDDFTMCAINPINMSVFCLLLYFTVRRFTSRTVALAVTAIAASMPASMHYTECAQADIPLMLIGGASLFNLFAWLRERRTESLILAAVLMAGALFCKQEGQIEFAAHVGGAALSILIASRAGERKKLVGQLALYLVITGVLIAPWIIYRSTIPLAAWQMGGESPTNMR